MAAAATAAGKASTKGLEARVMWAVALVLVLLVLALVLALVLVLVLIPRQWHRSFIHGMMKPSLQLSQPSTEAPSPRCVIAVRLCGCVCVRIVCVCVSDVPAIACESLIACVLPTCSVGGAEVRSSRREVHGRNRGAAPGLCVVWALHFYADWWCRVYTRTCRRSVMRWRSVRLN